MPVLLLILISSAATAAYLMRKTVTLVINGNATKFVSYQKTIGKALEKKKITVGEKDKITPSLESDLVDGQTINLKKAIDVKVNVDGRERTILSSEDNVGKLLDAEGIVLKGEDKVSPDKNTLLTEDMSIEVIHVERKTFTESIPINFKGVVKTNKSLANTKQKIIQEGKLGEKQIFTEVVYENGKEVSRKVVKETITAKPRDRIVMQGTYPLMPVSRGGSILPYSKVINARTTAYWAVNGVGKTYTASGRKAVRNPDGYSTVAVDRKVIPYGTKLFIEGYGFAIAADTGSSIVGNKIDVFFNTYKEACRWAVKNVKVYILK